MTRPIPAERIESRIYLLRGHKVMLSTDLADLYEVEPRALVQAVKRNMERRDHACLRASSADACCSRQ